MDSAWIQARKDPETMPQASYDLFFYRSLGTQEAFNTRGKDVRVSQQEGDRLGSCELLQYVINYFIVTCVEYCK